MMGAPLLWRGLSRMWRPLCFRIRCAWLIEWSPGNCRSTYYGGTSSAWPWTGDRQLAIRFAGKADADAMIHLIGPTWPNGTRKDLVAVLHAWVR